MGPDHCRMAPPLSSLRAGTSGQGSPDRGPRDAGGVGEQSRLCDRTLASTLGRGADGDLERRRGATAVLSPANDDVVRVRGQSPFRRDSAGPSAQSPGRGFASGTGRWVVAARSNACASALSRYWSGWTGTVRRQAGTRRSRTQTQLVLDRREQGEGPALGSAGVQTPMAI